MAERPDLRGAAISLLDTALVVPEVMYLPDPAGPVVRRNYYRQGQLWLVTYEAVVDHTGGWRVFRTTERPLIIMEGDHVQPRLCVLENRGPQLLVEVKKHGGLVPTVIDTDTVVFLEEHADKRHADAAMAKA